MEMSAIRENFWNLTSPKIAQWIGGASNSDANMGEKRLCNRKTRC